MGGLFHARAYTRASSCFALFAFTTFTNSLIINYLTIHYKGIRNTVYLSLWRKGINFHFFEEKSPQRWTTLEDDFPLENHLSVKVVKAKNRNSQGRRARHARASTRPPPLPCCHSTFGFTASPSSTENPVSQTYKLESLPIKTAQHNHDS